MCCELCSGTVICAVSCVTLRDSNMCCELCYIEGQLYVL